MAKLQFSRAFWVANTVELFERAVYYGVSVVITLYLSRILGFDDILAAAIAGVFSACLYLLPFVLLTCGYLALALIIYGQVGRRSGSQWPKIGIADTSKQFVGPR